MPEQKLGAKKDAEEKERKEYENDIAQKLAWSIKPKKENFLVKYTTCAFPLQTQALRDEQKLDEKNNFFLLFHIQ